MATDPGLPLLLERFTARMKKMGFGVTKDMGDPSGLAFGRQISRRFYTKAEAPFPLMQIGPGLFASNQSSDYEWQSFRKQAIEGVSAALLAYPALGEFKLEPIYFELRYIDAFDKSLLGHTSIFEFLEQGTTMRVVAPGMLSNPKLFSTTPPDGRLLWRRPLRGRKDSMFTLDVATGTKDVTNTIVRLESKVLSSSGGVPRLTSKRKFLQDLGKWLEFAHEITSPFFHEFITPKLMKKFEQKK